MFRSLPPIAILLGLAGLLPYLILGLGAVGTEPVRSMVAAQGLVAYGAVILAFLGGVHWGSTLGEHNTIATSGAPARNARTRLAFGVVPALIGWAAMIPAILLHPVVGLAVLIGGFIATLVMEFRAEKRDLLPGDYLALRSVLTAIVLCVLIAVMVVRTIGGHVLL